MRRRDESGSMTPLIIGLAVVVLMLIGVVVDASSAFLHRQQLNSIADAAALAATDGLQGDQVYTHGLGERALIDPAAARQYVAAYVDGSAARGHYPGLTYEVSTTAETVVVRVRAPITLPFHIGDQGRTVVSGTAASVVTVSP